MVWISAGVVSWCLSTYIFTRLLLPVTLSATAYLNENMASFSWAASALRVLIPQIPAYLLSFIFCMGLGRVSRVTLVRVAGFIVAAGGISLYYHLMQLAGYVGHHYEGGGSALDWMVLGMISLVFISPLFAVMGSLAGNMIRKRAVEKGPAKRPNIK